MLDRLALAAALLCGPAACATAVVQSPAPSPQARYMWSFPAAGA